MLLLNCGELVGSEQYSDRRVVLWCKKGGGGGVLLYTASVKTRFKRGWTPLIGIICWHRFVVVVIMDIMVLTTNTGDDAQQSVCVCVLGGRLQIAFQRTFDLISSLVYARPKSKSRLVFVAEEK